MFVVRMDIYGFWLGIIAAETVTNILLFTLIGRFHWERHARAALMRIKFNPTSATTEIVTISASNEGKADIKTETAKSWVKLIGVKLIVLLLFMCFLLAGIVTSTMITF